MSVAALAVRLVFDRSLNPDIDTDRSTVATLQDVLLRRAPQWSAQVVVWEPNPRAWTTVAFKQAGALANAVATQTRTTLGFNSGSVDLRGATREFLVVVSVNDRPTRPVGGRQLMPNGVTIDILRRSVEGMPSTTFASEIFEELCRSCAPLWGAVHLKSEYTAKVMQTTPSLRAIGRDFSRFLPGLFAINYFDNRYVELVRSPEIFSMPGNSRVEHGAFLRVADPNAWEAEPERYSAALEKLGKELFFDRSTPDSSTVAPTFAEQST
jgi:hypothetical protein